MGLRWARNAKVLPDAVYNIHLNSVLMIQAPILSSNPHKSTAGVANLCVGLSGLATHYQHAPGRVSMS